MRKLSGPMFVAMACLLALSGVAFQANAARELAPAAAASVRQEIVVFEVENCIYCGAFRQNVLPAYRQSPRNAELPLRFVDVNATGADKMKLVSPIQVVPTVVMLRDGQEVDRITGYTGPETFFLLVAKMLQN
jgi:thioredoxin-related protein